MPERHRILVADDDPDAAHALAELLRLEGHTAIVAIGGREAMRQVAADDHRIAFFDATLPGRSEVESFRELRLQQMQMRSYLTSGYSIGQLLQQTVASGNVQMLGGSITRDRVAGAVRDAGPAGIILIASSGPEAGQSLHDLLAESEYEVAQAADASDARAQIEERRVHVVILDAGLRVVDAAGVYAALQAEGHAMPTIILANGYGAGLEDALATGVIPKPYDPKLLLDWIDRLAA